MNYWLVKSEPFKYSWDQFVKDKRTYWDGVRNYQARNNLNAMKKGDAVLFYHSNEGLAVVGIARVVKEAYQDPTTDDQRWVVVDLEPVEPLPQPVPLSDMKQEQRSAKHCPYSARATLGDAADEDEFEVIVAKGQELGSLRLRVAKLG